MIKYMTKERVAIGIFVLATLAILGPMLLPGYVLTLDMVWPDKMELVVNPDGFNNTLPLTVVLALFGTLLPSWVVQKIVLVTLFFLLLYLPYRFLPYIPNTVGRLFAALLYTLNPFVYARMLAGQWGVLLGYALLPVLLFALVRTSYKPDTRSSLTLATTLLFIGATSIHYFYIGVLFSLLWLGVHACGSLLRAPAHTQALIRNTFCTAGIVAIVSMYWILPAFLRETPIEARFDRAHFEAFAASQNHLVPTPLNILVLGGFWAEDMLWRYDFVWPQDTVVFWISALAMLALVCVGAYRQMRNTETRFASILLVACTGAVYLLAFGACGNYASTYTLWLYEHMPGWSGLRDSHKLTGLLTLFYAIFAGVTISALYTYLRTRAQVLYISVLGALFAVPICFGLYEWGGFYGQLAPVWYPASWYEARAFLSRLPPEERVLTLPWRGYFSLPFVNQRIVSNPFPSFFGARIHAGRSIEVGEVYDQEVDDTYRDLDTFVRTAHQQSETVIRDNYARHGIRYLLVINNVSAPQDNWLLPASTDTEAAPSDIELLNALLSVPHTMRLTSDITLYEFSQ